MAVKLEIRLLLVALLPVVSRAECPVSCQCYQQSGINSIFCLQTSLTEIPNYFNFEVKILNFTDNYLPNLTDTFRNQHYKSLEILDLSRNSIENIDERSLFQLKNLLEIDLSSNHIRSIPTGLFDNNRFLNTVHFRGNPIDELVNYAFSPSIYLRRLNFQGCKIRKIQKFTFVNTPLLEYLNLNDNNLKSLSLNVLYFTPKMNALLLDGNPWHCDKKLWHLLKWMQSKHMANNSLLCIYGETEDAILWDTMDVKNALKFRDTKVPLNVKRIQWNGRSRTKTRSRRTSAAVGNNEKVYGTLRRKSRDLSLSYESKSNDMDYPSLDPRNFEGNEGEQVDPGMETDEDRSQAGESRNYSSENEDYEDNEEDNSPQLSVDYNKHGDPKLTMRYDTAKLPKQTLYKDQQRPPDWSHNFLRVPNNGEDYPLRHLKQSASNKIDGFHHKQIDEHDENSPTSELNGGNIRMMKAPFIKVSVDYYNGGKKIDQSEIEKDQFYNGTDVINEENADSEDTDGVNMKFMLMVIAVEFLLLAVLLFVLYTLWKSNRRRHEAEKNAAPLNNNKNMKTHDIQSPGYKRYSLSDDDYTDLRKSNVDENKYDSESGYLSYHRYNSIEGETSNDGMHFRRNPRDENDAVSAYTNAELDLMNGNNRVEENDADRRIRRNSSMRSMGRRAKINIARRSYSEDLRHDEDDDK